MKCSDYILQLKRSSQRHLPFIIAEAGVNHEASLEIAKDLIRLAAEGNAQAIKFQTYKAEKIASKFSPSYWDRSKEPTASQFELFQKYDKFWKNEFEILKKECDKYKIEFMSTPFDFESAKFLNDLVDVHKISSSDITNRPFIELIGSFGKPILLSTGASTIGEISDAIDWLRPFNIEVLLLHCVLMYPTLYEDASLDMILKLKRHFPDHNVGYSDHTLPGDMDVLTSAYLLGAQVIEKHFTHNKKIPGNDHYHAMDVTDLKRFWHKINFLNQILNSNLIHSLEKQNLARQNARRSIVASRNLKAGDKIQLSDFTFKRPAHGISPKHINSVLGRVLRRDVNEDMALQWEFFEEKLNGV